MYERDYIQPPKSYFDRDASLEYDVFKCGHCGENHSENIYFDHLSNCNICIDCLENDDCQMMMSLDDFNFNKWKKNVIKNKPINPI